MQQNSNNTSPVAAGRHRSALLNDTESPRWVSADEQEGGLAELCSSEVRNGQGLVFKKPHVETSTGLNPGMPGPQPVT